MSSSSGGLKMPKRGEAARLLSELNAEHALPDTETAPAPQTALGTTQQREEQEQPQQPPRQEGTKPEGQSYDGSYGNMTDNTAIRQERRIPVKPESRKPSRMVNKAASNTSGSPSSMAEAIRSAIQQGSASGGEILKTVTIKLSPELDRRVEDHCHEYRRKKQEVIRDAILLYFEVVEGNGGADGAATATAIEEVG